MFNFIRDFEGDGFTIMHHGMAEHFSPEINGSFRGDYGSYVWREWDGHYRQSLVGPYDTILSGAGLFVVISFVLGCVVDMILTSSAHLYSSIAYLALAFILCKIYHSDTLKWIASWFIVSGFYQMGYCFIQYTETKRESVLFGVLGLTFVSLFAGIFFLCEDCEGLQGILMGMVFFGNLFLGVSLLARDYGLPLTSDKLAFMVLAFFAGVTLLSICAWVILILTSKADANQKQGRRSCIYHMGICIVAMVVFAFVYKKIPPYLLALVLPLVFLYLGYATTHAKDNPYAARCGFSIVLCAMGLLTLWSQNYRADEIAVNLMNNFGLGEVAHLLFRIGTVCTEMVRAITTPLNALSAALFPHIASRGQLPIWIQCVYVYCLVRICVMIGIDLHFRIYYKRFTGHSLEEDSKEDKGSSLDRRIYTISFVAYCIAQIFIMDAFVGLMKTSTLDSNAIIDICGYGSIPLVLLLFIFAKRIKTDELKMWIMVGVGTLTFAIVNATEKFDLVGHNSRGAGEAWKQFGIVLFLNALAVIIGFNIFFKKPNKK